MIVCKELSEDVLKEVQYSLEPVCSKKPQKNPNQKTGLGIGDL